jgi:hypothetical protein
MKYLLVYLVFSQSLSAPSVTAGVIEVSSLRTCQIAAEAMARTVVSPFVFRYSCSQVVTS